MDSLTRLVLAARSGDSSALDTFVSSAYGQVRRLCGALVDEQSADDLAQEAFARSVRALRRYRGDSSARTWVLAIARNVCMDELRARSRRRRRDASLEVLDARRRTHAHDASEDSTVSDLVARLEPDRRAAFVLTQLLGLSYEETGAVCRCAVGTVRSRVARARADLLELLEGRGRGAGRVGSERSSSA